MHIAEKIVKKYDGNFSILYNEIKSRVDISQYRVEEYAFWDEFCCFELDYALYYLHMLKHNLIPAVVYDIGCQTGFQSEIFKDKMRYVGIDIYKTKFFNSNDDNVSYIVGAFPEKINIDLYGKTVISNMSMGWFNSWIKMDNDEIIKQFIYCNTLYIGCPQPMAEKLKKYFDNYEQIGKLHEGYPRLALWQDI
jgi:SAM-dependent methyltransferase